MLISHLLIRQNIPTCRGYLRAIVYHKSWCKLTPEEGIGMKVLKIIYIYIYSKAVPLQARSGPEGSRKLRFPNFVTTAQDGGKVVSLTHQPHFTPTKYSWY